LDNRNDSLARHTEVAALSLEQIRERLHPCGDVMEYTVDLYIHERVEVSLFYCNGQIDHQQMQLALIPELEQWAEKCKEQAAVNSDQIGPGRLFRIILFASLFAGSVIVVFSDRNEFYRYDLSSQPGRSPEESTMELSLQGPRDGFVELLAVNVALVRKRLRTPDLHVEYRRIGSQSMTEIALLHMSGIARPELVKEAQSRLDAIHITSLNGGTHLEELITDRPFSLIPLIDYIGRPDYVVQSLMKGKVVILIDGTPAALIAPADLLLLTKSPEDAHLPFYFVSLERLIRVFGLVLSLCLPGFWVALSIFNTDQIPYSLLATITISRVGLPISAAVEMFMMLTTFELFREAGVRLPRPVGQTISVVGGLIVGDAAIKAGLTSPTMLVAAAVTSVATYTLVNQSLTGSVTILRYFILICSSVLGIFGFFVGTFGVLLYMCSLESFGLSFLSPLAPMKFKQLIPALLQKPWRLRSKKESR
jgi:hypothetical protein